MAGRVLPGPYSIRGPESPATPPLHPDGEPLMAQQTTNMDRSAGSFTRFLRATEIDTRLLGMIGALLLIWVGFHLYGVIVNGNGVFLTPRNLWNISVQTA